MGFWGSAPKGLFPDEPEPYLGPKVKVAIVGSGLAGLSTAIELLEQGHEVRRTWMHSQTRFRLGSEWIQTGYTTEADWV